MDYFAYDSPSGLSFLASTAALDPKLAQLSVFSMQLGRQIASLPWFSTPPKFIDDRIVYRPDEAPDKQPAARVHPHLVSISGRSGGCALVALCGSRIATFRGDRNGFRPSFEDEISTAANSESAAQTVVETCFCQSSSPGRLVALLVVPSLDGRKEALFSLHCFDVNGGRTLIADDVPPPTSEINLAVSACVDAGQASLRVFYEGCVYGHPGHSVVKETQQHREFVYTPLPVSVDVNPTEKAPAEWQPPAQPPVLDCGLLVGRDVVGDRLLTDTTSGSFVGVLPSVSAAIVMDSLEVASQPPISGAAAPGPDTDTKMCVVFAGGRNGPKGLSLTTLFRRETELHTTAAKLELPATAAAYLGCVVTDAKRANERFALFALSADEALNSNSVIEAVNLTTSKRVWRVALSDLSSASNLEPADAVNVFVTAEAVILRVGNYRTKDNDRLFAVLDPVSGAALPLPKVLKNNKRCFVADMSFVCHRIRLAFGCSRAKTTAINATTDENCCRVLPRARRKMARSLSYTLQSDPLVSTSRCEHPYHLSPPILSHLGFVNRWWLIFPTQPTQTDCHWPSQPRVIDFTFCSGASG